MSDRGECPECGWEINHKYSRCLHCGASLDGDKKRYDYKAREKNIEKKSRLGCFAILVIAAIIGGIIVFSGDGGSSNSGNSGKQSTNNIGDVVKLKHSQAPSFLAIDSDAWDKMTEAISAKDETGMRKLMLRGKVFLIKEDLKAKILDIGFTSYKVRITDGPHEGKAGWVYRELVAGKN